MARQLDELVVRWAELSEGPRRGEVERALVAVAHPVALRAARDRGLRDADADDAGQEACAKLLTYLAEGGRIDSNAEGWVYRTASNVATDIHRRRKRQKGGLDRLQRDPVASPSQTESAETLWEDRERLKKLEDLIRPLLDQAPENYRLAMERHWFDGIPLEKLAAERLQAMLAAGEFDPSDPVAKAAAERKARNFVDKHLQRGRDWLRKRLEGKVEKGEL